MENNPLELRRVNVRAIIFDKNKILAVRHKSKDNSPARYYSVPGGGLDPQESLQECLARELVEEVGVAAKIGRLLFIQQFPSDRKDRDEELEFFFEVENVADFKNIDISKTSHGSEELAECEFIDPKTTNLLPKFLQTVDLASYIHDNKPVLLVNYLTREL